MKRIALLGARGFGHHYVHQIMNLGVVRDTGRLVAAIDPAHALIEPANPLRSHNVPLYASLDDFLARDVADLFIIATPISTHVSLAKACLATGGSVFLKKPLCATTAEAAELIALADSSAGQISIGYQWAYSPAWRQVKRLLREGALGEPEALYACACWPRNAAYYQRAPWAGRLHLIMELQFMIAQ